MPQKREANFFSFTSPLLSDHTIGGQYNAPSDAHHPEFGQLPFNSPDCHSCVEIIEKRKIDERYFVNAAHPEEFIIQKSLGDLHYLQNGQWVTIDHHIQKKQSGIYEASHQPDPVGFDIQKSHSYIITKGEKIKFNHWKLYGKKEFGEPILIADADWNQYSAGDDGIFIRDIFPGIDAEMQVFRGSIKTNFIIRTLPFNPFDTLIFTDEFHVGEKDISFSFPEHPLLQEAVGDMHLADSSVVWAEIKEAVGYPQGGDQLNAFSIGYTIEKNRMGLVVPLHFIKKYIGQTPVVIDPIVTSSNTLAQAAIAGSRYNPSCNFNQSCDYSLTVATPAAATYTDILWSFDYKAYGMCWLEDGALRFTLTNCLSPNLSGYYWFCPLVGTGTCYGTNISVFSDLGNCLPSPSCTPQNLTFGLQFFRSCYGMSGCDNACIGAGSPWVMTLKGRTIEFSGSVSNEFTLSSSSICAGESITATAMGGQFGVPPYSWGWSLNAGGSPSVGSGISPAILFPQSGSYTIYCFLTDACNQTVSASKTITVQPAPSLPVVSTPVQYCQGDVASPLSATGTQLLWYTTATGGTGSATAPTPLTASIGTVSYYVSQTAGGCESEREKIDVVVSAIPPPPLVITPISYCQNTIAAPLTADGNELLWYSSLNGNDSGIPTAPIPATTQVGTFSFFTSQTINHCESLRSQTDVTILPTPPFTAPIPSITYCMGATPVPIEIPTNDLLWYDQATGGTGSAVPPTPSTGTAGIFSFYVSEMNGSCESERQEVQVTIFQLPVISGTPAVTPSHCDVSSGTITGLTVISIFDFSCSWYDTSSSLVSTSNTSADLANQPAGHYTLIVTDENNCSAQSGPFAIGDIPAAAPPQVVTPISYCEGVITWPLEAIGQDLLWYTTADGGSGTPTAPTPSSLSAGTTTYYVSQTVNGCESDRAILTVVIHPLPEVTLSSDLQHGCSPFCTTLHASGTSSGTPITSWVWSVDGVFISDVETPFYCFTGEGVHALSLTATDGNGCYSSVNYPNYITVVEKPIASFSVDKTTAPFSDPTIVFTNESVGEQGIQWDFGDGKTTSDEIIAHTFDRTGTSCVSLVAINDDGCQDKFTLCVEIFPDFFIYIPNAFSPNGDQINDVWMPECSGVLDYQLSIYNRWGESVFESTQPDRPWLGEKDNGSHYSPNGIYVYRLIIKDFRQIPHAFSGHIILMR